MNTLLNDNINDILCHLQIVDKYNFLISSHIIMKMFNFETIFDVIFHLCKTDLDKLVLFTYAQDKYDMILTKYFLINLDNTIIIKPIEYVDNIPKDYVMLLRYNEVYRKKYIKIRADQYTNIAILKREVLFLKNIIKSNDIQYFKDYVKTASQNLFKNILPFNQNKQIFDHVSLGLTVDNYIYKYIIKYDSVEMLEYFYLFSGQLPNNIFEYCAKYGNIQIINFIKNKNKCLSVNNLILAAEKGHKNILDYATTNGYDIDYIPITLAAIKHKQNNCVNYDNNLALWKIIKYCIKYDNRNVFDKLHLKYGGYLYYDKRTGQTTIWYYRDLFKSKPQNNIACNIDLTEIKCDIDCIGPSYYNPLKNNMYGHIPHDHINKTQSIAIGCIKNYPKTYW